MLCTDRMAGNASSACCAGSTGVGRTASVVAAIQIPAKYASRNPSNRDQSRDHDVLLIDAQARGWHRDLFGAMQFSCNAQLT